MRVYCSFCVDIITYFINYHTYNKNTDSQKFEISAKWKTSKVHEEEKNFPNLSQQKSTPKIKNSNNIKKIKGKKTKSAKKRKTESIKKTLNKSIKIQQRRK